VSSTIVWETDRGNPNAVIHATVLGDWAPDDVIAVLERAGSQGRAGKRFERRFSFAAPTREGNYRVRWVLTQAFRPVSRFYGKRDGGANDPGGGTWAEVHFTVTASDAPPASTNTRRRDWYADRIRTSVQDEELSDRLQRAIQTAIEIRDNASESKRQITYAALKSIGRLSVSTPDGPRTLEDLARQRIIEQVPALAGSDVVEEPATVVAALLISDREYFLHKMKIVQVDGRFVSIADALESRTGLDPATTRDLLAVAAAADALAKGEDILSNIDTLRTHLDQVAQLIEGRRDSGVSEQRDSDQGGEAAARERDRRRDEEARDRQRRDREMAEQQRQRDEAARRAEQERLERDAAERRRAEEDARRQEQQRAYEEAAQKHPWGLAGETVTDQTRRELGLFPGTTGVVIRYVKPGSIADSAGLRAGTVIESIQHRSVSSTGDLDRHANQKRSGDQLSIGIWQKRDKWERATRMLRIP
jgi:hypothetical protein